MDAGFMSIKDAIILGKLSMNDIGLVISQIFNVTAYLHSQGIFLDHLDIDTVFIKGNLVKLTSFGVYLIPYYEFYQKTPRTNDLALIG